MENIYSAWRGSFEMRGADVVECGVASDEDVEDGALDQLGSDRVEERLDHGICTAISLARHGDTDAVAAQFGRIAYGAVLVATIRMVNEPFGGRRMTRALRKAASARSRRQRSPTIRQENRSMTTAR